MGEFDQVEGCCVLSGKVLEMCDRVKVAHKITPGASAHFAIQVDGVWFDLLFSVQTNGHGAAGGVL